MQPHLYTYLYLCVTYTSKAQRREQPATVFMELKGSKQRQNNCRHRAVVAIEAAKTDLCIWISATSYFSTRRALGRTTHRGMSVLDSLRYELKTLVSGQVSLLSDILTNIAEGAKKQNKHTHTCYCQAREKPKP